MSPLAGLGSLLSRRLVEETPGDSGVSFSPCLDGADHWGAEAKAKAGVGEEPGSLPRGQAEPQAHSNSNSSNNTGTPPRGTCGHLTLQHLLSTWKMPTSTFGRSLISPSPPSREWRSPQNFPNSSPWTGTMVILAWKRSTLAPSSSSNNNNCSIRPVTSPLVLHLQ